MENPRLPSLFLSRRLNFKKIREAMSLVEEDAAGQARQDAKVASDLHVAHLEGEINRDTAELNSPWCDLLRTGSEVDWKFETIWQAVQQHLSSTDLYPAGGEQEAQLFAGFACQLSTFWLSTYAGSEVVPHNVTSKTRELYEEKDFWPVFSAWYDVEGNMPGNSA